MKIVYEDKKITVVNFSDLDIGDVYKTRVGVILMKITQGSSYMFDSNRLVEFRSWGNNLTKLNAKLVIQE